MWQVRVGDGSRPGDGCLFLSSCYGAETEETPCCSTCEEVREAYRKRGWAISNPKVAWGNFCGFSLFF